MTGIFISYSRKDSAVARKLMQEFKTINLDVWVDWEDIPPAVGWLDEVLQGIERADAFVFLVSPDSAISEVCKVEVEHARKNHKRIVPILVRDVDAKSVVSTIRDLNWIYLREQDDFKTGLEKVTVAITIDIEWVQEHRRLQVRALDWDRKKDPSLLLRGGDLRRARQMIASAEKNDPKPSDLQKMFIEYSRRDENRKTTLWISAALAIMVMAILSVLAVSQWRLATANEKLAQEQRFLAEKNAELANRNADLANENAKLALDAQMKAEQSEVVARAQRSAARAQIYQSRTGGLFTSTLLAIDSWRLKQSYEAEEILRKNISLLPLPVDQLTQGGLINALEFNPDGNVFISASADHTACAWQVQDGKQQFCIESPGAVKDATFTPAGDLIVTGDESGEVLIVDALTGEIQDRFNYQVAIRDVNISPDGKSLAIARDDGRITIINLKTRELGFELYTYGSLNVTAFSPDGEWIAAGSATGSITLWNLGDGRIVTGPAHRGQVFDIAFSPDGRKFVSGGSDSVAFLALTTTGQTLFKVTNENWVEDVTFSPDGSWFVTASDDFRVRVWDTNTGQEKLRLLQDSIVVDAKVSPNGRWIAATGKDQTIRVWNAVTGTEMLQVPLGSAGNVLAFSPDGNYLVSGDQKGGVGIWGLSVLPPSIGTLQFSGFLENMQISPSGDWLAASSEGRVWLLSLGRLSTFNGILQTNPALTFDTDVKKLVISPDSKWMGLSTGAGEIYLVDIATRSKRLVARDGFGKNILFSSDGPLLIAVDNASKARTWEMTTFAEGPILFDGSAEVATIAVSANTLALGLTDKILVLDVGSGSQIAEIRSPGSQRIMTFSPDGTLFVSSNSSGQLSIWGSAGKEFTLLYSLPGVEAVSLAFDLKSRRLFVGTMNELLIYDPLTGHELYRIRHQDAVNGISFSADGNTLATSSLKAVQLWDIQKLPGITTDDLVTAACSHLTQNFSSAEWTAFFGEETYRKLCEKLPGP
ncbi:putative serine/threonine-protein kinase PkwA [Anaerolineales bacterium]|nr:putative serine/threonine-protein kinase PkwA [Anaerolineales bacterium]